MTNILRFRNRIQRWFDSPIDTAGYGGWPPDQRIFWLLVGMATGTVLPVIWRILGLLDVAKW